MSDPTPNLPSEPSTPNPRLRKRDKLKNWLAGRSHNASPSPSKNAPPATPAPSEKLKDSVGVLWSSIETSLKLLNECSAWNPILKSAVGGIVACIDLVGKTSRNQKDIADLTNRLGSTASMLQQNAEHASSLEAEHDMNMFLKCIQAHESDLQSKKDRWRLRQGVEAADDEQEILHHLRQIAASFDEFQTKVLLRIERNTDAIMREFAFQNMRRSHEAAFNMDVGLDRHACTEGTRKNLLDQLKEWATNPTGAAVYWLNGLAGTGKTTISMSFSNTLVASGILGASFFCSRQLPSCGATDGSYAVPSGYNITPKHGYSWTSKWVQLAVPH